MNELTSAVVCRMTEGGRTSTDVANYVWSCVLQNSYCPIQISTLLKMKSRENKKKNQNQRKSPPHTEESEDAYKVL